MSFKLYLFVKKRLLYSYVSFSAHVPNCFQADADIHRSLLNIYRDSTIENGNVHRWIEKFNNGETTVKDKPRIGKTSTVIMEFFL